MSSKFAENSSMPGENPQGNKVPEQPAPAEGGADKVAPAADKVLTLAAPAGNKASRQEASQAMTARIVELHDVLGRASGGWGVSQMLRTELAMLRVMQAENAQEAAAARQAGSLLGVGSPLVALSAQEVCQAARASDSSDGPQDDEVELEEGEMIKAVEDGDDADLDQALIQAMEEDDMLLEYSS